MATHIMMAEGRDPTVMIGGTLPMLHAAHRVGGGDTIIVESCEYYNSFLSFFPTVAVITNVDSDHLDFFRDLDDIKSSFRAFASLVPDDGYIVANGDDENTMDAIKFLDKTVITFGMTGKNDIWPDNIVQLGAQSEFDIIYKGNVFARVSLRVPGEHNIKNALAATAACICLGADPLAVQYGLSAFTGAGRRFEFKGKYNGADIYDDYAHHPNELKCLIDATQGLGYKRTIVVFQPHTYSRTKALFGEFVEQLKRPDITILAEIYSARETNTVGISSKDIAKNVPNSLHFETFGEIVKSLKWLAAPGDLILTVGAGDIYKIGEELAKA